MKSQPLRYALTALTICFLLAGSSTLCAQNGVPDASFDGDGIYTNDVSATGLDVAYGIAEQADGKLVVAGYSTDNGNTNSLVMRMHDDGSPDLSFDADGKVLLDLGLGADDRFTDMALQPDGKILAVGFIDNGNDMDVILVRLLADGSYDPGFGTGGKVQTDFGQGDDDLAYALALQADGRIVVAGRAQFNGHSNLLIARYTSTGLLDTSFDVFGSVTFDPSTGGDDGLFDVTIAPDGKIVATGYSEWGVGNNNMIVARVDAAGQPDLSFSSDGFFSADLVTGADEYGYAVHVMADGSVLVAGSSNDNGNTDAALIKLKSSGILDNTFNTDGKAYYDFTIGGYDAFRKLHVQQDGSILAAGQLDNASTSRDFLVAKMDANGDLDGNFGTSGWATADLGSSASDNVRSMLVMTNGKVIVGGYGSGAIGLVRFTNAPPVGLLAPDAGVEGLAAWPQPFVDALRVEVPASLDGDAVLTLVGMDGRIVLKQSVSETMAGMTLDLSDSIDRVSTGMYVLSLRSSASHWSVKLLRR